MLRDSFYSISDLEVKETKTMARVSLNPEHPIYKGHFPGNPVTPGVCQIQIIKETLGNVYGKPYVLKSAKSIKFLNILDPQKCPIDLAMDCTETDTGINVSATLADGKTVFLKLSGYFQPEVSNSS